MSIFGCGHPLMLMRSQDLLLQICSCPAVVGPKCALQAQEVTRSARDRFKTFERFTAAFHAAPCARPGAKKRLGFAFFQRVTADPTQFHVITARFGFGAVLESPARAKSDPVSSRNARFSLRPDPTGAGSQQRKQIQGNASRPPTTSPPKNSTHEPNIDQDDVP
jgi:hypothetical protein